MPPPNTIKKQKRHAAPHIYASLSVCSFVIAAFTRTAFSLNIFLPSPSSHSLPHLLTPLFRLLYSLPLFLANSNQPSPHSHLLPPLLLLLLRRLTQRWDLASSLHHQCWCYYCCYWWCLCQPPSHYYLSLQRWERCYHAFANICACRLLYVFMYLSMRIHQGGRTISKYTHTQTHAYLHASSPSA